MSETTDGGRMSGERLDSFRKWHENRADSRCPEYVGELLSHIDHLTAELARVEWELAALKGPSICCPCCCGHGTVSFVTTIGSVDRRCPDCNGTGRIVFRMGGQP